MNLVLVEPAEIAEDTVVLTGRRATHVTSVLGATVGATIRAGVVGGPRGTAEVVALAPDRVTLRLALDEPASRPLPLELVLAVPRPKVLSRTIEIAASFGVARIELTNAWRVDKAYLKSPRLAPDALSLAARLGAEQGATTHVPAIRTHARLMQRLDEPWPDGTTKLLAHPGGTPIVPGMLAAPCVLAIGPEGGWIQREVDTFVARGFAVVSLGAPILRVEAAVAALLGQLIMGMNAGAPR